MQKWVRLIPLAAILMLGGCSGQSTAKHANPDSKTSSVSSSAQNKSARVVTINWRKPSEAKPYPDMQLTKHNWIRVSIKQQRVFIMNPNHKVLYTMNASTGAHNSTPRGTYHIQAERGAFFYNQASKEGAHYWTSWKDHGIYLFHTVPTNAKGQYIQSEAKQLGKTANSHGCIRLSIPDAKWINQHVPTGTKVVVES